MLGVQTGVVSDKGDYKVLCNIFVSGLATGEGDIPEPNNNT